MNRLEKITCDLTAVYVAGTICYSVGAMIVFALIFSSLLRVAIWYFKNFRPRM